GRRTVLGLFDHLKAPKGKVWISFDKPTFVEGEAVVGKVNVEAGEYVQSLGVRVEARVFENYTELVWVTINNTRVQEHQRRQNVLFSRDVKVTGAKVAMVRLKTMRDVIRIRDTGCLWSPGMDSRCRGMACLRSSRCLPNRSPRSVASIARA